MCMSCLVLTVFGLLSIPRYEVGEFLGQGSFGKVNKVTEVETGSEWASKEVVKERANPMALKMLDREIIILKKVMHP
jgi:serine/threonine protein kinase